MAIMSGKSPHATFMGSSCLLGHMIDNATYGCRLRHSSLTEMENATLSFEIVSWQVFARGLEKLRRGATSEWARAAERLEAAARPVVMSTRAVVKVSHFGSVNITMSWTKLVCGSLEWVDTSTAVVELMVNMIMQFVEICT